MPLLTSPDAHAASAVFGRLSSPPEESSARAIPALASKRARHIESGRCTGVIRISEAHFLEVSFQRGGPRIFERRSLRLLALEAKADAAAADVLVPLRADAARLVTGLAAAALAGEAGPAVVVVAAARGR